MHIIKKCNYQRRPWNTSIYFGGCKPANQSQSKPVSSLTIQTNEPMQKKRYMIEDLADTIEREIKS